MAAVAMCLVLGSFLNPSSEPSTMLSASRSELSLRGVQGWHWGWTERGALPRTVPGDTAFNHLIFLVIPSTHTGPMCPSLAVAPGRCVWGGMGRSVTGGPHLRAAVWGQPLVFLAISVSFRCFKTELWPSPFLANYNYGERWSFLQSCSELYIEEQSRTSLLLQKTEVSWGVVWWPGLPSLASRAGSIILKWGCGAT